MKTSNIAPPLRPILHGEFASKRSVAHLARMISGDLKVLNDATAFISGYNLFQSRDRSADES
jgi:hypothetical protein